MAFLIEAKEADASLVIKLITDMQAEIGEVQADKDIYTKSIVQSFSENVHWFLFLNENDNLPFGVCYLQSVHNYWRLEKRFYLGGFYISPNYRGNGSFKKIYALLRKWVLDNGGIQIYAHIHEKNAKSLAVFKAVGLNEVEYKLLVEDLNEDQI